MNTNTRATSRTWKAHTTYRECSVVTALTTHMVTITRTASGFQAIVDGLLVGVLEADRVLRAADRLEIIAEMLENGPIGTPATRELHHKLSRLGFHNHYQTASDALAGSVPSLAALSEADAYAARVIAHGQWGMTA
ncbi:hypothetical protein [Deinococcus marmoris]|uniref:hypothetical protein n=1 Tax=Deinococcus marmoris TaxID=249408 RepID=UPI0006904ED4|nr:hypothetical protein [Deinococcus marmoris]